MDNKTEARWHSDLGKVMFTPEHAASLDAAEAIKPSGWVMYDGQDDIVKDESSKSDLNAGNNADSRQTEESDEEQKSDSKGKKPRK